MVEPWGEDILGVPLFALNLIVLWDPLSNFFDMIYQEDLDQWLWWFSDIILDIGI